MESFLSHFDADEFVDFIKHESFEDGYDSGYNTATFKYYLRGSITKKDALEENHLTPEQSDKTLADSIQAINDIYTFISSH